MPGEKGVEEGGRGRGEHELLNDGFKIYFNLFF